MSLPDPTEKFVQELEKTIHKYVWDGKRNKIKKTVMCQSYEKGGLKMLDVRSFFIIIENRLAKKNKNRIRTEK